MLTLSSAAVSYRWNYSSSLGKRLRGFCMSGANSLYYSQIGFHTLQTSTISTGGLREEWCYRPDCKLVVRVG